MKNYINGSDLSAIIGLNPYKTPYAVWASIVNSRGEKEPDSAIKISNMLQPAIASLYEDATGKKTVLPLEKIIRHIKHDFLAATPNRFIEDNGVLQTYSTQKFIEREFIPQHWYLKIIWDMGVTNKKSGVIAWLERGLRYKQKEVDFDEELFAQMVISAIDFWNDYVLTRIPPRPMTRADVKSIYRKHTALKYVPATEQSYNDIQRLKLLKDERKFIDGEIERLQSSIEFLMGDAEALTYGDRILATWKNTDNVQIFNIEKFREINPGLYDRFLEEKPGERQFTIL